MTALVPVADGTEEMEAVIIVDTLRRAGIDVTMSSVEETLYITASRGVKIVADSTISDSRQCEFDLIALPGGMPGATRLHNCKILSQMLKNQADSGRFYAAICAAPAIVLEPLGLLDSKSTCHPAFSHVLEDAGIHYDNGANPVIQDGKCITSRGPGTAFAFALTLVKLLVGREKALSVAEPMCLPQNCMECID